MAKILIVNFDFSKQGGIEYVAQLVYKSLEKNHLVNTIARKGKSKIEKLYKDIKIIIQLLDSNIVIFIHPFLFERYKKFIPKKVKSIVWTHGIEVWGNWGKHQNPNLNSATKIVAVSKYSKQQILRNWPKINNVELIHNSILDIENQGTINQFSPTKTRLNSSPKELITVARLAANEKYKGHDLVIYALDLLRKKGLYPFYNIVGKGDDIERLKKIVGELNLSNQVQFYGYVPDEEISHIYRRSSIFVMPSYVRKSETEIWGGEGFGLVYLEAGLHQLPVIACDEGGQTDCIIDGKTGFLVKPEPEQIAEKIEVLLNQPKLAQEMGRACYQNVMENFTFERFKKDVLQLIEET